VHLFASAEIFGSICGAGLIGISYPFTTATKSLHKGIKVQKAATYQFHGRPNHNFHHFLVI
jgi:hypothetical protein